MRVPLHGKKGHYFLIAYCRNWGGIKRGIWWQSILFPPFCAELNAWCRALILLYRLVIELNLQKAGIWLLCNLLIIYTNSRYYKCVFLKVCEQDLRTHFYEWADQKLSSLFPVKALPCVWPGACLWSDLLLFPLSSRRFDISFNKKGVKNGHPDPSWVKVPKHVLGQVCHPFVIEEWSCELHVSLFAWKGCVKRYVWQWRKFGAFYLAKCYCRA